MDIEEISKQRANIQEQRDFEAAFARWQQRYQDYQQLLADFRQRQADFYRQMAFWWERLHVI